MMKKSGFTLAELLLALVILGVIATFTIPKVLSAQTDTKFKSIGKEAAGMLAETHQRMKLNGLITATTKRQDFTPYFNYVRVDTTTQVDFFHNNATLIKDCSALPMCLRLHNGGMLYFDNNATNMAATASTSAIPFLVDPDGRITDGTTNGMGRAVRFWVYYDGKIRTEGTMETNTCDSNGCLNPAPTQDPPWFGWN